MNDADEQPVLLLENEFGRQNDQVFSEGCSPNNEVNGEEEDVVSRPAVLESTKNSRRYIISKVSRNALANYEQLGSVAQNKTTTSARNSLNLKQEHQEMLISNSVEENREQLLGSKNRNSNSQQSLQSVGELKKSVGKENGAITVNISSVQKSQNVENTENESPTTKDYQASPTERLPSRQLSR